MPFTLVHPRCPDGNLFVAIAVVMGLGAMAALSPRAAAGQRIAGLVLEDSARSPIAGVQISLVDEDGVRRSAVLTDSTGGFVLSMRAGTYRLDAERLGYQAYTSDLIEIGAGETMGVEIRLGIGAVPLEPLRVTARSSLPHARAAEFYRRRGDPAHSAGYFVDREDLDRNAVSRTTTVLSRVPAITLIPVARVPTDTERYLIYLRGGTNVGGTCAPALYLDGVRIQQNASVTIDEFVDPSQLEGVEVYSRASVAPAEFGGGNDCGVVAFWSRVPEQGGDGGWKRLAIGFGSLGALLLFLIR